VGQVPTERLGGIDEKRQEAEKQGGGGMEGGGSKTRDDVGPQI